MEQLWLLLERQVKDYHKRHHMGENSSVTQETARELLSSLQFTLSLVPPQESLGATLALGQQILAEKLNQVKQLWRLVQTGTPAVDDDWLPETLVVMGRWLESYDLRFFAHWTPEPEYPLLRPVEDSVQGIFYAEAYLAQLRQENQILRALDRREIPGLLEAMVPDHWAVPMNLCEQALINGLGRVLLRLSLPPLSLSETHGRRLAALFAAGETVGILKDGAARLSRELALNDSCTACVDAVAAALLPRLEAAIPGGDLSHIFVISHECHES